jgi:3-hydroxyacyl-[acyl-carrier-protein] dehydratase
MSALDVVLEHRPGQRALAVRHVPQTLDVFRTHFPRFPVLPGVLILDDLTAVARLALADQADGADRVDGGDRADGADGAGGRVRWELASARRVRWRRFVEPGDSMEITVDVLRQDAATAHCRGVVTVDGTRVTTVQELILRRIAAGDSP